MPHIIIMTYKTINILINTLIIFSFTVMALYAYSMALALNLI
jgi:hypothetical protein